MNRTMVTGGSAEIALGTVQFGLDYGVSNPGGRTMPGEVAEILRSAEGFGIRLLDTAAAYGESETVLGQAMAPGAGFDIVTKTPALDAGRDVAAQVRDSFAASLARLQRERLYGLLTHRCDDLLEGEGGAVYDALLGLRDSGAVARIGVSVYTPEQVDAVLERFPIDLVQLPLNLLDQRMHTSGAIDRLVQAGVEVHVRSCFLQGVLLMSPEALPAYLHPLQGRLNDFRREMADRGLSPLAGALAFARQCRGVSAVVVGVCSREQLVEIAEAAEAVLPDDFAAAGYASDDPALVDPRNWPNG